MNVPFILLVDDQTLILSETLAITWITKARIAQKGNNQLDVFFIMIRIEFICCFLKVLSDHNYLWKKVNSYKSVKYDNEILKLLNSLFIDYENYYAI